MIATVLRGFMVVAFHRATHRCVGCVAATGIRYSCVACIVYSRWHTCCVSTMCAGGGVLQGVTCSGSWVAKKQLCSQYTLTWPSVSTRLFLPTLPRTPPAIDQKTHRRPPRPSHHGWRGPPTTQAPLRQPSESRELPGTQTHLRRQAAHENSGEYLREPAAVPVDMEQNATLRTPRCLARSRQDV